MIYPIQSKIYIKLRKSLYAIISLILISFILFVTKYQDTSSQKREETISRILKSNYFLKFNKFIFQKINSPFLNISHKIMKGENLNNVFKNYNIDQKDISKANSELKKFIKPNKLKQGVIIDLVIKKNMSGSQSLMGLNLPISKSINISLSKDINNKFIA